jgi:hypothetical protein
VATKQDLQEWVAAALRDLNGQASLIEVAKNIWEKHEKALRSSGDLFYTLRSVVNSGHQTFLSSELFFIEPSFKGRRRQVAESGLLSLSVVENLNILRNVPDGLLPGFITAVEDQFTL